MKIENQAYDIINVTYYRALLRKARLDLVMRVPVKDGTPADAATRDLTYEIDRALRRR